MIVGILGGTFDPPHLAHLMVATRAIDSGLVDEVWLVPCLTHRFGKSPVPFVHRIAMCERLTAKSPCIKVTDIEAELDRSGYTLDLVKLLRGRYPTITFRLIAGTDIYHERDKWHRYDDVAELAPPIFVERRGVPPIPESTLDAPPPISSSDIRARIARGETVDALTTPPVWAYIQEHDLYRY